MNKLRIYVENSVIGGYFEKEFETPTKLLFEMFRKDIYIPVISQHVLAELSQGAPDHVINLLTTIKYEVYELTNTMDELKNRYMEQRIVSKRYEDDALHIAIATILKVDALVSWNFKHIVNLNKINLFNSVNIREGYKTPEIRTPQEVVIL